MVKIINKPRLASSLAIGLLAMSSQAFAHLPGAVVIDFDDSSLPGADPLPAAVGSAFGQFYQEDAVIHSSIGFGTAPGNSIGVISGGLSHVHGSTTNGSRVSQLEADAGGGLFQLVDGDPFSVTGLDVADLNLGLIGGGNSTLTFRGYTSADYSTFYDVQIGESGGAPTDVNGIGLDFDTGAGINGTHIHLDDIDEFGSLYLFEYFFDASGRGNDPSITPAYANLLLELDNVELGPEVSAVPVPAAVYLFGSAMLGLVGFGRKKTAVVEA